MELKEILNAIENFTFEHSHENNIFIKNDIWLDCDFEISDKTSDDPLEPIIYDVYFELKDENELKKIKEEWNDIIEKELILRYEQCI